MFEWPCIVTNSFSIKPTDKLSSKFILVTQLYMFRATSLPIIRSYLLYNWHRHILCWNVTSEQQSLVYTCKMLLKFLKLYRYSSWCIKFRTYNIRILNYSRKCDSFCRYSIIFCLPTRFDFCLLAGSGWNWFYSVACSYWSVGLKGNNVWSVSWNSWHMGLCSPVLFSEINWLWCRCVWMYSCSYGSDIGLLLTGFNREVVLYMGPYSCLLFRMFCAQADWGLLYFII